MGAVIVGEHQDFAALLSHVLVEVLEEALPNWSHHPGILAGLVVDSRHLTDTFEAVWGFGLANYEKRKLLSFQAACDQSCNLVLGCLEAFGGPLQLFFHIGKIWESTEVNPGFIHVEDVLPVKLALQLGPFILQKASTPDMFASAASPRRVAKMRPFLFFHLENQPSDALKCSTPASSVIFWAFSINTGPLSGMFLLLAQL